MILFSQIDVGLLTNVNVNTPGAADGAVHKNEESGPEAAPFMPAFSLQLAYHFMPKDNMPTTTL